MPRLLNTSEWKRERRTMSIHNRHGWTYLVEIERGKGDYRPMNPFRNRKEKRRSRSMVCRWHRYCEYQLIHDGYLRVPCLERHARASMNGGWIWMNAENREQRTNNKEYEWTSTQE